MTTGRESSKSESESDYYDKYNKINIRRPASLSSLQEEFLPSFQTRTLPTYINEKEKLTFNQQRNTTGCKDEFNAFQKECYKTRTMQKQHNKLIEDTFNTRLSRSILFRAAKSLQSCYTSVNPVNTLSSSPSSIASIEAHSVVCNNAKTAFKNEFNTQRYKTRTIQKRHKKAIEGVFNARLSCSILFRAAKSLQSCNTSVNTGNTLSSSFSSVDSIEANSFKERIENQDWSIPDDVPLLIMVLKSSKVQMRQKYIKSSTANSQLRLIYFLGSESQKQTNKTAVHNKDLQLIKDDHNQKLARLQVFSTSQSINSRQNRQLENAPKDSCFVKWTDVTNIFEGTGKVDEKIPPYGPSGVLILAEKFKELLIFMWEMCSIKFLKSVDTAYMKKYNPIPFPFPQTTTTVYPVCVNRGTDCQCCCKSDNSMSEDRDKISQTSVNVRKRNREETSTETIESEIVDENKTKLPKAESEKDLKLLSRPKKLCQHGMDSILRPLNNEEILYHYKISNIGSDSPPALQNTPYSQRRKQENCPQLQTGGKPSRKVLKQPTIMQDASRALTQDKLTEIEQKSGVLYEILTYVYHKWISTKKVLPSSTEASGSNMVPSGTTPSNEQGTKAVKINPVSSHTSNQSSKNKVSIKDADIEPQKTINNPKSVTILKPTAGESTRTTAETQLKSEPISTEKGYETVLAEEIQPGIVTRQGDIPNFKSSHSEDVQMEFLPNSSECALTDSFTTNFPSFKSSKCGAQVTEIVTMISLDDRVGSHKSSSISRRPKSASTSHRVTIKKQTNEKYTRIREEKVKLLLREALKELQCQSSICAFMLPKSKCIHEANVGHETVPSHTKEAGNLANLGQACTTATPKHTDLIQTEQRVAQSQPNRCHCTPQQFKTSSFITSSHTTIFNCNCENIININPKRSRIKYKYAHKHLRVPTVAQFELEEGNIIKYTPQILDGCATKLPTSLLTKHEFDSTEQASSRRPKIEVSEFFFIFNLIVCPKSNLCKSRVSFPSEYSHLLNSPDVDSTDLLNEKYGNLTDISSHPSSSVFDYLIADSSRRKGKVQLNSSRSMITKRTITKTLCNFANSKSAIIQNGTNYGDNSNQVISLTNSRSAFKRCRYFAKHSTTSYSTIHELTRDESSHQVISANYKAHIDSITHTQNWLKFRHGFENPSLYTGHRHRQYFTPCHQEFYN